MIKGTNRNLSDFKSIIGNKGIKVFKTEMWTAMQLQQENIMAIAAGLIENPPVIIKKIEKLAKSKSLACVFLLVST